MKRFHAGALLFTVVVAAQTASKPPQSSGKPQAAGPSSGNTGCFSNHTVEPIIISDGSVEVTVYSSPCQDAPTVTFGTTGKSGTLSTPGTAAHVLSYTVPTGVTTGGTLKMSNSLVAHDPKMAKVVKAQGVKADQAAGTSYSWDIESSDSTGVFAPYAKLKADLVGGGTWKFYSPDGKLQLSSDVKTGKSKLWPTHSLTTYKFESGNLRLRIAGAWVNGTKLPLNVRTGCTAFQIASDTHDHQMSKSEKVACSSVKVTGGLVSNIKVSNEIRAIDVTRILLLAH